MPNSDTRPLHLDERWRFATASIRRPQRMCRNGHDPAARLQSVNGRSHDDARRAVQCPWRRGGAVGADADTLAAAQLFALTTVRADGRPHQSPLVAVWLDDAIFFSTGPTEQKHRNLEVNANVLLTTGPNDWQHGLEIVVEGAAERVTEQNCSNGW